MIEAFDKEEYDPDSSAQYVSMMALVRISAQLHELSTFLEGLAREARNELNHVSSKDSP